MTAAPAVALLVLAATAAADWPQWRGPGRDGVAPSLPPRAAWPKALRVAWRTPVGVGHASPVADSERAYAFAREGELEVVSAHGLDSGRRVWRQAYEAPYSMNPAAAGHGNGPKSTPTLAAGRLYTFGISGVLSCLDAATGRLLWRREFADRFRRTAPLYGVALSPLVVDGLVIVHAGGHDDGALVALAAATGVERWAWPGDGPAYASPVLATLGGRRQVVAQTQSSLAGFDLATGERLWSLPLRTAYDQNAVTPLVVGDLVVYSGLGHGVRAVQIAGGPGGWTARPAWSNDDVSLYMSSPVRDGARIYGLSHRRKGQFFCLDAATGRTVWVSQGRQADNAALVLAAGALLALTTEAELLVMRPGARFEPLATYTVAPTPTWAHPAVTSAGILVKDENALSLWRTP